MTAVDLVQYLRDRLDERAAKANAARDGGEGRWRQDDPAYWPGRIEDDRREPVVYDEGSPSEAQAVHIVDNDPARVLLRIEAERKILNELLPDLQQADRSIEGEWGGSSDLADRLVEFLLLPYGKCRAQAVFWPDDEACEAVCILPRRHGGTRHEDETLGGWDEAELSTSYPSEE